MDGKSNFSKGNRTGAAKNRGNESMKTESLTVKPGAYSVAGHQVAHLDARISEKCQVVERGAFAERPPDALTRVERDRAAKQQVYRGAGSSSYVKPESRKAKTYAADSSDAIGKPGAVAVNGSRGSFELLENRISQKINSNSVGSNSKTSRGNSSFALESLEERINAKVGGNIAPEIRSASQVQSTGVKSHVKSDESGKEAMKYGKMPEMHGLSAITEGVGPEKSPSKTDANVDGLTASGSSDALFGYSGNLVDDEDVEYGIQDYSTNSEGLAVAVPVQEDDPNVYIPSAVQYDPTAKPPIYLNRRFRLYAFLALFVLVVAAAGAGLGFSFGRDVIQSQTRVHYREKLGIKEQIQNVVGGDVIEDESSPYAKALYWITYKDPMEMTPDEPNFLQRYFMTYVYYATTETKPWYSCNPPDEEAGENEYCVYERLVSPTPVVSRVPAVDSIRWLSKVSECSWVGVLCDEFDQVRSIDLNGMNFTGVFPVGIEHLPFLQTISLVYGELRGPLPKEVANLKHLVSIEMHYNQFTGTIPKEWFDSRNLQRINLSSNRLSGRIPPEVRNLRDVKGFYMFENQFTGSIPDESFSELRSLAFFRWHRNLLTGTMPSSLGFLDNMAAIWLHENRLSGTIPTEWGLAPRLVDVRVQNNERLTGPIPEELYGLSSAFRFDLFNCNFTGTISEKIGSLSMLSVFRAHNNQFTGTLPSSIGRLSSIRTLTVIGNQMSGSVPDEICALRASEQLSILEADCLPLDSGSAAVFCPEGCCTFCCRQGEFCSNSGSE